MNKRYVLALSILLYFGILWARFDAVRPSYLEGDKLRITGYITESPMVIEGRQQIRISDTRVFLEPYPEYFYGDYISVQGVAKKGKGGWYLQSPEVLDVKETASSENKSLLKPLYLLSRHILEVYKSYLPEPHATLAGGIVLGTKNSLDSGFLDALQKTGTLHIIVASGTNIALVGGTLLGVLAPLLGRKKAIAIVLVSIWIYVVISGIQPPLVRAAIMGSIAFWAQVLGRESQALRALVISGLFMLLVYPLWLFDLGFQLSFMATLGIILLGSRLSSALETWVFSKIPKFFENLKSDLSTSLAAQLAVSPILFFSFGEVSLISPIVNLFILWTVPVIMALGAGLALLGLLSNVWGIGFVAGIGTQIIAWIIWLPLEYFVQIIRFFGN